MKIPNPIKDLLPLPMESFRQLAQVVAQPQLIQAVKDAAQRVGLSESSIQTSIQNVLHQAQGWKEAATDYWIAPRARQSARINATGEFFDSHALHLLNDTVMLNSMNDRWDSEEVNSGIASLLKESTGAKSAIVVSSFVAGINAIADGHRKLNSDTRWIVPRVDCTTFEVAEPSQTQETNINVRKVLDYSRVAVCEIGSNSHYSRSDFESTQISGRDLLYISSPNGAGSRLEQEAMLDVMRETKLKTESTLVAALFDGALHRLEFCPDLATTVSSVWSKGVDVVLLPSQYFLAGPEACIVLFREKTDLERSVREASIHLGVEASFQIKRQLLSCLEHTKSYEDWKNTQIGISLTNDLENLQDRAKRIVLQSNNSNATFHVVAKQRECRLGRFIWSQRKIESATLVLQPRGITVPQIDKLLNRGPKQIRCNHVGEGCELVLRSIDPADDRYIVQCLNGDEFSVSVPVDISRD